MGRPDGFMIYERKEQPALSPAQRLRDFHEFHASLSETQRREQAARCMNCGVPLCQSAMVLGGMVSGCPLHNLIPEWNDELYHGNDEDALARLLATNPFPEFTGRVCPALCEKACICGMNGDPVTIRENELSIIEKAFKEGRMKPSTPVRSGKKVAVVGSGPSGLAAAWALNRMGHEVHVYERDDRAGGLLMYGIPNMKLEKQIVERRVALMVQEGIVFHLCCDIMHDIRKSELAALLRHHGVQDNVHENVAELLAHVGVILCRDGVQKLAALLHNERHQRFMRLLAVPRTPVRRTQSFHDADQFLNIGT